MNKELVKSIQQTTDAALSQARETMMAELLKANEEAIAATTDQIALLTDMMTAINNSKEEMIAEFSTQVTMVTEQLKRRHEKLHAAVSKTVDDLNARLKELNPAA